MVNIYPILSEVSESPKSVTIFDNPEILNELNMFKMPKAAAVDRSIGRKIQPNVVAERRAKRAVEPSAAMISKFEKLLTDLRKSKNVPELSQTLKSSKLEISVLDEAMHGVEPTLDASGLLKINDSFVNTFEQTLKSGNLARSLEMLNSSASFTRADSEMFSELSKRFPQNVLNELDGAAEAAKLERPHLNVTINNFGTLSETAKSEIDKFYENLTKYFKVGTYVTLGIGTILIGDGWLERALRERRGCWMVRVQDGKQSSCRISKFTCGELVVDESAKCSDSKTSDYAHPVITYMSIVEKPDQDSVKIRLASDMGTTLSVLNDNPQSLLDTQYPKLKTWIERAVSENSELLVKKVCDVKNPHIESGKVPYCRMCDPKADPRSTQFAELDRYYDDVTFTCVENPSILDVMTDAAFSTGRDLWNGISSTFNTVVKVLKYGAIAAFVLIVLLALYFIVTRVFAQHPRLMADRRSRRYSLDAAPQPYVSGEPTISDYRMSAATIADGTTLVQEDLP